MSLWQQYLRPQNLTDALDALSAFGDSGESVAVIAGGTDLLLDLDQGRHLAVETLIDVTAVDEMLEIRQEGDFIFIGAALPLRDVITDDLVRSHFTALVEACELIGGPQVRNVATLGGNVAHALPAGDGTIALLALGAEAEIASAKGAKWVSMEELFLGPGEPNFDRANELVVRFRVPASREGEGSAFRRVMRPQGVAIAILNMGARLRVDEQGIVGEARLAIGPAGPRPLRAWATEQALVGGALDEATLKRAMTAAALLERNPNPTETEIREALKDTLCRCAGYPTIIRSIQAAADSVRTGNPVAEPKLPLPSKMRVIGQVVARPDAVEKVDGSAKFADDYSFPDMLYGATLRAGTPHAILRKLDISAASKAEGVVGILTAEDIPGEINHGLVVKDWPALVGIGEKVRYVGDAVALVVADTLENAQRALDLIEAEYEDLPVVSDPVQARETDAPDVHENGNLLKHIKVRKGDLEAGFEEADIILEDTYHTAITEHAFLEPECAIARLTDEGRIEVYVGSQIPYADRSQIARCLDVADDEVRVIGTLIGGGFGGKEDIAGQIHAAMLAKETGRPVKILYDRHESMLVHPKRHATQIRVKLGAKNDGTLVAVETELYGDTGAYASLGEKVMTRATTHSAGPYVVPHVKADCYAMYTNNPPAGAFRGFGVTQSAFAVESMMDDLAEQLELDPIELRRHNALEVGSLTNTGQELRESAGLIECLNQVTQRIQDFSSEPFVAQIPEGESRRRRAWGIAAAYKNTGLGGGAPDKASAEVELYEDGAVEVRTSSAEIGQGLVAVLQMIAAEELTVPIDRVRVLLSDTDLTPDGGPTTASRQTYVTGNAVRHAADVVKQAVATTLAEHYDVPPTQIEFHAGAGHRRRYALCLFIRRSSGRGRGGS